MANSEIDHEAAVRVLMKGREIAERLGGVIRESPAAEGLYAEVMSSFSRALEMLSSGKLIKAEESPEGDVIGAGDGAGAEAVCGNKRKSRSLAVGRGGYRRRKQASQLRTVRAKSSSDEHSWRKYGQKEIHSSKHPRSYFRCTHKYDQNCMATKQVQKSDDDPSLFLITYMGHHTCTTPAMVSNLMLASDSMGPGSVISFGSNACSTLTDQSPFPSSPVFSHRQEFDEEVLSRLTPGTCASSDTASQPGEGDSGGLDMSFLVDSFDFEGTIWDIDNLL